MWQEETVVKQWQLERIKQREMPHKLCQLWHTHTYHNLLAALQLVTATPLKTRRGHVEYAVWKYGRKPNRSEYVTTCNDNSIQR